MSFIMNAAQSPAEAMWIEYIKAGEVLHRTTHLKNVVHTMRFVGYTQSPWILRGQRQVGWD
jgi:hypothetical protein